MIDLHIHLLPGVDDGCSELADTLELARAAVADGITAVAVTPHVSETYRTTAQAMLAALEITERALVERAIPLAVRPGAEIALDQVESLSDAELRAFSLGGSGQYVLVECPFSAWPLGLELVTGRLAQLGLRTVFAHPERSAGVQSDDGFEALRAAVERGLLVQVNAGSLAAGTKKPSGATARRLLDAGLVHLIASDAHEVGQRPPRMAQAAAAVGDGELATWLTEVVPDAIMRGERLPEAPPRAAAKSGGLLGRLKSGRR